MGFATASEQFDSSTSTGKLMLNMLLSFAQFERELTRERTMSKMAGRAQRGLWNGGWVPLGYDYDKATQQQTLTPNEGEAPLIGFIFQRIIETGSPCEVANAANSRGYRTKLRTVIRTNGEERTIGGKRLDEDIVIRIVKNPIYRGHLYYSGETYQANHEPVVDEESWGRANAALGRNGAETQVRYKDDHVHLLKGLLV